jgi:hypothetical protein
MKITRAQLRRLISEALDEGSRIIIDPQGEAFVASDAYTTGAAKDAQSFGYNPNLDQLKRGNYSSDPIADMRQGRDIATAMELQDELNVGEETAQEMGQKKAMLPDLQFHNELPQTKSIEFSQYLKRECDKRGFTCTVQDTRHLKRRKPFIKVHIEGEHPLRYEDIIADVYINDTWMKSLEIDMRAQYPDAPAGLPKENRGVLTAKNTKPYISGDPGYGGLEALAELVVDAVSEL